ncbi:MAG: asparagine synthase (glutamine-hydrolyzing) [Planctomycetota bacterium]
MCGICGIYSLSGRSEIEARVLEEMTAKLTHRGPDDAGMMLAPGAGLGIRRLKVIDLETGHQPIENETGTLATVYNGEVYNYRELRVELEARGHRFRTRTDTEVILHLYEERGPDALDSLNGMFAIAIYDRERRALFLARDRMGIKPLYYGVFGDLLLFGSEPKSILCHPRARGVEIRPEALAEYLANEFIAAPRTIFRDLSKLEAGHYLIAQDGRIETRRYWERRGAQDTEARSPVEAERRLEELLLDSVRRRLIADVPVGVFLSGGIDSSTIAALACRVHNGPVRTFSVGFEDPSFDESPYAKLAADSLGTDHYHTVMTARHLQDALHDVVGLLDEPLGDASIIPTYLLSKFTREHVTVALAGDGGDELFAGYPTYIAHRIAKGYRALPELIRTRVFARAVRALPVSKRNFSLDFMAKRFLAGVELPPVERHMTWMGSFTPGEIRALLRPDFAGDCAVAGVYQAAEEEARLASTGTPLEMAQRIDLRMYLEEDILVKTDRASMANSLEVRVPYLDHRIVEFALGLPMRWKLHGVTTKWILKRIAQRYLPARIVHRPKKGFGIPVARWLDGDLKSWAAELLSETRLARQGIFDPAAVTKLLADHHANRRDNRKGLWTILIFQLWYSRFMEDR